MEPISAQAETQRQLASLRERLSDENPQIYRHWALYLQVLREELPRVVDRACFHVAVAELPRRYSAMPASSRQQLHARLASLVRRTAALLTVEQLQALARQSERRQLRAAQRQQRRLLAALQPPALAAMAQDPAQEAGRAHEPPGSVRLDLDPPISTNLFAQNAGLGQLAEPEPSPDQDAMLHVFADLLEAQAATPASSSAAGSDQGLLPTHPVELLHWLEGMDTALKRRLRNLSHAINVELVRQGLTTTLLPLRLLEAIAAGQVEVLNAPLHLVRLALPGPHGPQLKLPEVLCVLLRPADLEADCPRLRTCQSRLQQSRLEVRRMAQTFQRLERRLEALDAEALWLHDHSTAHPGPSQPTV